jgi:hypothetical protein
MMSRTLGACLGGTMRGAHQGFDCRASSLITPPNFGSGAGSCLPLIVAVALGEPGGLWLGTGSAPWLMPATRPRATSKVTENIFMRIFSTRMTEWWQWGFLIISKPMERAGWGRGRVIIILGLDVRKIRWMGFAPSWAAATRATSFNINRLTLRAGWSTRNLAGLLPEEQASA